MACGMEERMTKRDFLRDLEQALSGQLPPQKIQENLRYYDSYIEEQIASGRTEAEVLAQLGDARLIAQSILAASGVNRGWSGSYADVNVDYTGRTVGDHGGMIDFSKWYWKLAAVIVVILVIALVLLILSGLLRLLFYIAVPVIAVVAVIALIEYLKDRR